MVCSCTVCGHIDYFNGTFNGYSASVLKLQGHSSELVILCFTERKKNQV